MSVDILAIKFNHDQASATSDALNIRKNAKQVITVPEWRRGVTTIPEDSLAAYAIRETKSKTITIQAKFTRTNPKITTAEVRAVQPPPPPLPKGWLKWLLDILEKWPWLWHLLIFLVSAGYGKNVLGEVKAKKVAFQPDGETDFETFELQKHWLVKRGVGIHMVTWQWQYRLKPADPWMAFATTHHKIYTILEVPKSPWQQTPYGSTQLPWTEVLDYACRWASWAFTLDEAATRITNSVYKLGTAVPPVVEYDCPGSGGTHYAWPNFNCTAFLDRLKGGVGLKEYINCTDCATIVSTFANILGCDLWQSRMHEKTNLSNSSTFECNEIIAIGHSTWNTPCGWKGFSYHEVAWKGACDVNDEVFDACLKVDGDSDPTGGPPHTPLLPVKMKFGKIGSLLYRDRLAAPKGRPKCNPQPSKMKRRKIV